MIGVIEFEKQDIERHIVVEAILNIYGDED